MVRYRLLSSGCILALVLLTSGAAPADVFNMGDGQTSLDFVTVGNAGNAADTEVMNDGTTSYGSVAYEYRMGTYEVTAGQYTAFLNAVAATDTYALYSTGMGNITTYEGCNIQRSGSPGSYSYSVAADWANRPVNCVSWGDAARFANWLTNGQPTGLQGPTTTERGSYTLDGVVTGDELAVVARNTPDQGGRYYIPTEDEWYKAAYYNSVTGTYYDYATGSDTVPSNVLGNPTDPGNNATFHRPGYTIGSPYYRTEVGDHENSDSPYGTFDQDGNVAEWTEGTYDNRLRYLRGGSYETFITDRLSASNHTQYASPTGQFCFAGFRICEVPEPGTLSLLVLGGGGLLVGRRRRGRR